MRYTILDFFLILLCLKQLLLHFPILGPSFLCNTKWISTTTRSTHLPVSVHFSCGIVLQLPITGRIQLFHCALEPLASGLLIDIAPAGLPRWLYHHIISLHRIFPNDVYMYHDFFTLKKNNFSLLHFFFQLPFFSFFFFPIMAELHKIAIWIFVNNFSPLIQPLLMSFYSDYT